MDQDAYMGEIAQFAGASPNDNNWLPCDGRLLPINGNQALFTLIGNMFGGDGTTNFGLPNLAGRIPIAQGKGSGLSPRNFSARGGGEYVTMTVDQLPAHTHAMQAVTGGNIMASSQPGINPGPDATHNTIAAASNPSSNPDNAYNNLAPDTAWNTGSSPTTVSNAGGGQPFSIMQPYLAIAYFICVNGIYPSKQ